MQKIAPAGTTYYGYDAVNRMTSAEPPGGVVSYTYNGDDKRVRKETLCETTKFVWDFQRLLLETDDSDNTERYYTNTVDEYGDLISEHNEFDDTAYPQYDALGSAEALVDDSQSAFTRAQYHAFGKMQGDLAGTPATFVGKMGYYRDLETELYYIRRRYYDPLTGTWTSEDTIGQAGDPLGNLYRYGENNPTNKVDPAGRQAEDVDVTREKLKAYVDRLVDKGFTPEEKLTFREGYAKGFVDGFMDYVRLGRSGANYLGKGVLEIETLRYQAVYAASATAVASAESFGDRLGSGLYGIDPLAQTPMDAAARDARSDLAWRATKTTAAVVVQGSRVVQWLEELPEEVRQQVAIASQLFQGVNKVLAALDQTPLGGQIRIMRSNRLATTVGPLSNEQWKESLHYVIDNAPPEILAIADEARKHGPNVMGYVTGMLAYLIFEELVIFLVISGITAGLGVALASAGGLARFVLRALVKLRRFARLRGWTWLEKAITTSAKGLKTAYRTVATVRRARVAAEATDVAPRAADDLFDALRGRNLDDLTKQEVGEIGESIARRFLRDNGYTDIISIQNRSGNGIDIVARTPDGRLSFFEVKASRTGQVGNLSPRQQSMDAFVTDILTQASQGTGRYRNLDAATQQQAREMLREFRRDRRSVSGTAIGVDLQNEVIRVSPWN